MSTRCSRRSRGEKLAAILVTHTHRDHSPAAKILREKTGAPVIGCTPYAPRADSPRATASTLRMTATMRRIA